ncbi:delta(12) fatty acid desaturase-like protein [Tanacetum coccineum]
MGGGGQMNVSKTEKDILKRVPVSKPPFGLADLKKAIPPHCFKRSLIRSFASFFRDLIIIYSLFYLASYIPLLPKAIKYVAWPLYWFAQGTILFGFWLLGHDCGHHAFSEFEWVDDAVGFFIHTVTLTPYFSFKYSHRSHHAHTNSLEYDEVYIPKRKTDTFYSEIMNNGPGNVFTLILRVTLGYPLYLIFNIYGRDYGSFSNHFWPQSGIFNDSERGQIVLSDVGIMVVLYAYYRIVVTEGVKMTFFLYGMPLLVMGGFFIILTYLNHTHPSIAHYDSTEWDWIRGALSTIDRDYGTLMNWAFHDANPNHVIHHLFPTIPLYRASEARDAVKPILGDYYKFDDTPMLKALWRDTKECIYVEPDESSEVKGVYWYYK